jgi:hypothetical protein
LPKRPLSGTVVPDVGIGADARRSGSGRADAARVSAEHGAGGAGARLREKGGSAARRSAPWDMLVLEQHRHLDPTSAGSAIRSVTRGAGAKQAGCRQDQAKATNLERMAGLSCCRDRALEAEDRRLLRREGTRTDSEQDGRGLAQLEPVLIRPGQRVMRKGFEKGRLSRCASAKERERKNDG